jgi:2-polyprenyl-3-methyl-5-hydroxy-6-metoxy-1,4-benzoquinol methylase
MSCPPVPIPSLAHLSSRVFLDVQAEQAVESSWGVATSNAVIFECPQTGLRFREPIAQEEIDAFYQAGYHEKMAGGPDEDRRREAYLAEHRLRANDLKRLLPEGGRVLDIGCSTGVFAGALKEAGFDVLGSDISPDACAEAARTLGEDHVFCGPVEAIADQLEGSLDAITMMDVIEHFADVVSPLKAMHRMLRPGGILFLRTPTLRSPFYWLADLSYRLSAGRYKTAVLKIYHAEHFFFFTEESMRILLLDTGFEPLRIDADPLLWKNFRTSEMREGPLTNAILGATWFLGRLFDRGHGMKVAARRK